MSLDLPTRAPIYGWLAQRLAREISPEDWHLLRNEPLRSILGRLDFELAAELEEDLTPEARDALAEEFARLFLLPRGVPPLASHWVATRDRREAERRKIAGFVEGGLLALGRKPLNVEPWGKLPFEHLAVVLDLVSVAAAGADPEDRRLGGNLEQELLVPALRGFGAALSRESKTPLYRAIGLLISTVVDEA